MNHIEAFVALLVVVGLSVGCGGGGGGGPEGTAVMTLAWPSRSRAIPAAANSVTAILRIGTTAVATRAVARPASGDPSTVLSDHVRAGTMTVEVTAHPNADGSGIAQARGWTSVTISEGQTSTITCTMASTVDRLEMTAANPSVSAGGTVQLAVTGKDSAGAVVLLWPTKLNWTTTSATHATVTVEGLVTGAKPTGVTPGSVGVTVTDTESGKSVQAPLTVTSNATVTASPHPFTLSVGDTRTFAATVQNAAQTGVTWAVAEGAAGGTISGAGLYTAPAVAGTYHVVATSAWDNSKTGSATVEVQSGGAVVIID
ncbi:MAG: hypothetical protein FJX72_04010 [Armatimonadetes bacterium]|nr:hypothetical protein [Armatimonadota bacterium]